MSRRFFKEAAGQGGETRDNLNVPETAALLNRTEAAIYRLMARRQIPYRKYGRRLIFRRSELERLVEMLPGVPLEDVRP